MTDRELMQQALEALIKAHPYSNSNKDLDGHSEAITALRERLAKPEQEPVAWMYDFLADDRDEVIQDWVTQSQDDIKRENGFNVRPLYTAPLQWVGLTDQELKLLWEQYGYKSAMCKPFSRAIEAKLKEKNHAG
jgi:hypothetical protein